MNVIKRLERAGLTLAAIATATSAEQPTVRAWRAGRRFPSRKHYERLVRLGEERGLLFTADDFIVEAAVDDEAA